MRLRKPSLLIAIFVSIIGYFFTYPIHAQSVNGNWQQDLNVAMKKFIECESAGSNTSQCYQYMAQSLQTVYQINDFSTGQSGKYMGPNEIADFVKDGGKWEALGPAYDRNVLNKAQEYANAKKAVIAVYKSGETQGHMALILPGDLQISGSWGLKVPNSASFFLNNHDRSYIGKGLSYAFTKDMLRHVVVYGRKY